MQIISQSNRTLILLADADKDPHILKVLNTFQFTNDQVKQFYNEWFILRSISISGVRNVINKTSYKGRPAIQFEYIKGRTLREVRKDLNWSAILSIAIQIARILEAVHDQKIIHKDVTPDNIIVSDKDQMIYLIDFGIATGLNIKSTHLGNPEYIAGNLHYISPEQSGRMNRTVDHRSDLYSLGVTLFELWTGQVPFNQKEPLELVHCHLAVPPPSPLKILKKDRAPTDYELAFEQIILKLLLKNAEDRYQSARGLLADLELLNQLRKGRNKLVGFVPGNSDFSERFDIPQKLYGREKERSFLSDIYDQSTSGNTQLLLISGYSGVGKSALVYEIHKPITAKKGFYTEGKFDQFQRNIPYYAWIQAFDHFIQLLLTENPASLENWKGRFLSALNKQGKVLIELLPAFEKIIGPQPDLPELPPRDNQNRFNNVFISFIQEIARPEHPLFIFIDDWQWTDAPSLDLLEKILSAPDIESLMITGAYRDNEVTTDHPFQVCLNRIRQNGQLISTLHLENLTIDDIDNLLTDTLKSPKEYVRPLSQMLLEKTNGNAFFLRQMLQSIHKKGAIQLINDPRVGIRWDWDIKEIEGLKITENVVDLMVEKVTQLPVATREVLQLASCIGTLFPLSILSIIYQRSAEKTYTDLLLALEEGLIMPVGEQYTFAHDRIQQAVYSLICEKEKENVHLEIGRLMLAGQLQQKIATDKIFDVVNQLNFGKDLIIDDEERRQLAELNLSAGVQAKKSIANDSALHYLRTGFDLLSADSWKNHHQLTYSLHRHLGEAEAISLNVERADELFMTAFRAAEDLRERVEMVEYKLWLSLIEFIDFQGINMAMETLSVCGFEFSQNQDEMRSFLEKTESKIIRLLQKKGAQMYLNLPEIADEKLKLGFRIIPKLIFAINHQVERNIQYVYLVSKLMWVLLKAGKDPNMLPVMAHFGSILVARHQQPRLAYELSMAAEQIAGSYSNFHARVQYVNRAGLWCRLYGQHLLDTIPFFETGHQIGLENGNIIGASICQYDIIVHQSYSGIPIKRIQGVIREFEIFIKKMRFKPLIIYIVLERFKLAYFQSGQENLRIQDSFSIDHNIQFTEVKINNGWLGLCKIAQHFWAGEYELAINTREKYLNYLKACESNIIWADHFFHIAVSFLLYPKITSKQEIVLNNYRQRIEQMAAACPENFKHKHLLIKALAVAQTNNKLKAITFFQSAIRVAAQHGFIHIEALVQQLFARFWHDQNQVDYARIHFQHARRGYRLWEADYLAEQLEQSFPEYFSSDTKIGKATTSSGAAHELDLKSLLKAAQVLSGEIVLSNLVAKFLPIVLENAGAEQGYLLEVDEGVVNLLASASVGQPAKVYVKPDLVSKDLFPLELLHLVMNEQIPQVISYANQDKRFVNDWYIQTKAPKSVVCYPVFRKDQLSHLLYLENNLAANVFTEERLEVLQSLSAQIGISIDNALLYDNLDQALQTQRQITESYSRFVPHTFLKALGKASILEVKLGDQVQKNMTVLFADIREYTKLSETLSPSENFNFLNAFLKRVAPVISEQGGFISQYFGDGIMALFLGQPEDGLRAALGMLQKLNTYNAERMRKNRQTIRIGIGLHTGSLIMGILGDKNHQQATVVSDAVNTASRLEGLTKYYQASIIVSQEVINNLSDTSAYCHRFLGKVLVKGKESLVEVHEIFDCDPVHSKALKQQSNPDFQQGLHCYFNRDFIGAVTCFKKALKIHPESGVIQRYFKTAAELITVEVPADWTGAEVMLEK